MDINRAAAQTPSMARFRVAVTMQLSTPASVAAARLRVIRDAQVEELGLDIVRVVVDQHGRDSKCAAQRAFVDVSKALAGVTFLRPPAWTTRQLGLVGLRRRSGGRFGTGGDDDGLGGVREPRRPIPPTFSASLALDLPHD